MKTGFEPAIDSFTAVRYGSPTACLNIMDVFLYIYVKYVCVVYTYMIFLGVCLFIGKLPWLDVRLYVHMIICL